MPGTKGHSGGRRVGAKRPPIYGEGQVMERHTVRLTPGQVIWVTSQGNLSQVVRKLIDEAMKGNK